jgi:DNA-directed RNA polymerase subunit RPC12/RpoP
MENRLVVATTCPTCSAPLDFAQGTNAIQCGYCRSSLLVTGHKQILSYAISPKVERHDAVAQAQLAYEERSMPCCVRTARLYFIPYYRLTGHDLRWVQVASSAERRALSTSLLQSIMEQPEARQTFREPCKPQLHDRYIEKNFIACPMPGAGLHSLGIRPAVLRLELFRSEHLTSLGTVVPVGMSPREALAQGLKTVGKQHVMMRQVLGRMLSVLYFPYWVVEVERAGQTALAIVDAVATKVITLDAPCSLYRVLHQASNTTPQVIGFRPLVCPNCNWNLPLRTDDSLCFCTACDRAWQLAGSELHAVVYQVASLPSRPGQSGVTYLPFWILQPKTISGDPRPYYLPAFRYRRLKVLADLACRWTRKQPHYEMLTGAKPPLQGGFYDQGDAVQLAHFVHTGLSLERHRRGSPAARPQLSFRRAALTWFPFTVRGRYLIDPITGLDLQHSALLS